MIMEWIRNISAIVVLVVVAFVIVDYIYHKVEK